MFLCSWSRPVIDGKHRVFLPMNDNPAPPWKWNKANVQSVGGGFLVGASRTPSTAQRYIMDPRQRSINLNINLFACFWSADGRSVGRLGRLLVAARSRMQSTTTRRDCQRFGSTSAHALAFIRSSAMLRCVPRCDSSTPDCTSTSRRACSDRWAWRRSVATASPASRLRRRRLQPPPRRQLLRWPSPSH